MDTQLTTETPPRLTLAQVRERIRDDGSLPRYRRIAIRCNLNCLARLLGEDLADLPADLAVLRPRIEKLHHIQLGVSRHRLSNVRGDLLLALSRMGHPVLRSTQMRLAPCWSVLFDRLPRLKVCIDLRIFVRFCQSKNLTPENVTAETFKEFRSALENYSLVPKPLTVYRDSCVAWNKACDFLPSWPQLRVTVPSYRRRSIDPELLPASFRKDLENYLAWRSGEAIPGHRPVPIPLKPATLNIIRAHVYAVAGALIRREPDLGALSTLASLVAVGSATSALRYRSKERGGKITDYDRSIAGTVFRIARDWVRVGAAHLGQLRLILRRLESPKQGMCDTSAAVLRQFHSERNLQLLFDLPGRLMNEAINKDRGGRLSALTAQKAVMIELMLNAPLLPSVLVAARHDHHLTRPDGPGTPYHLTIPAAEIGGALERGFVLSPHATWLLDNYLSRFHSRLSEKPVPWLFPSNAEGRHKSRCMLSKQISETVYRYTGLKLRPRHIRHLAAKLVLDAEPGNIETVRLMLGHTMLKTTAALYQRFETQRAANRYDAVLFGTEHVK